MPEPATADSTAARYTRPDDRRRDTIARLLEDFHDPDGKVSVNPRAG